MAAPRPALVLALAACLAASAAAQLPAFSKPGGPPFLQGPTSTTTEAPTSTDGFNSTEAVYVSSGWYDSGKSIAVYPDPEGTGFVIETAEYTSWECDPSSNGSYFAVVKVTTTSPGAAATTKEYCEYGTADLVVYQAVDWSRQEGSCPTVAEFSSTLLEVPIDILNECGDPDNGIYPETSTTTDPSFGSTITTSETGLDVGSPLPAIQRARARSAAPA